MRALLLLALVAVCLAKESYTKKEERFALNRKALNKGAPFSLLLFRCAKRARPVFFFFFCSSSRAVLRGECATFFTRGAPSRVRFLRCFVLFCGSVLCLSVLSVLPSLA
jgi:hypothetical protein